MINFKRLERAAKRKGMTINEACAKAKINRQTYWHWQRRDYLPSMRLFNKLLKVLGLKSA